MLYDISEITRLREMRSQLQRYGEFIGSSKEMLELFKLIETIKDYNTSVLKLGETGTGKELAARTIHNMSNRKEKLFIPVQCSALPENILESELFGQVKGRFYRRH